MTNEPRRPAKRAGNSNRKMPAPRVKTTGEKMLEIIHMTEDLELGHISISADISDESVDLHEGKLAITFMWTFADQDYVLGMLNDEYVERERERIFHRREAWLDAKGVRPDQLAELAAKRGQGLDIWPRSDGATAEGEKGQEGSDSQGWTVVVLRNGKRIFKEENMGNDEDSEFFAGICETVKAYKELLLANPAPKGGATPDSGKEQ